MKLRSCGHLHFIQAIRGSSVVKVLNVDSRRRTALVFKKVKDIYETEDAKNPDSLSTRQPKDGFRGLYFECDREKIESPCHPMGERKTIKSDPETYDLNCSAGDNERDSELDDLSFGKMTLKQLKARCKTKKRKLSKFIDFTDENVETCSPVKQEYSDLRSEEEEFDLKEPLSHWKSMLTKKRKRINKCASSPSQSAISVKSEESPSDQDLLHSSVKLSARINIKAEVSDPIYSDCQNLVHVSDDSSIGCNEQVGSCGVTSNEMLGTSDGCALETGESISFTKEPRSCVVNEVSYDHLEYAEPNSLPNVADMGRDTMTVDDSEMSSHHSSVFPVPELKKQEDIIHTSFPDISPEILSPLKDHNSDVYDSSQSHSFPHEMSWQINSNAGAQLPEMAIDNGLQCVELSHGGGAYVFEDESKDDLSSNTEAGAASSPESNFCSSFYSNPCSSPDSYLVSVDDDSPTTDSFPHEMSWQINSSAGARLPEMAIDNSLQCVELSHGVGACAVEDDSKDDLPSNTEAGARSSHESFCSSCNSNPCLSPDSCLVSMEDDSPTADEEQSLISTSRNTSRKCSASIQLSDASAELSTSEVVGIYHYSELRHPPERLLSTRKAISPTSQERLCKAMDAIELHDDIKNYKCRVKLSFQKQTKNKASSTGSDLEGAEAIINVEGPKQIKRAEVTINHKPILRKPKNVSEGSPRKGILKVPHLSHVLPRVRPGCPSIQSCSESAIAFSQRQMHDIESLAMKLTTELKSMKDIVAETLHADAVPATSLKDNVDEIRMAIENATKMEETARRWLSMMARDCNRFCKIMRLTEKGTTDSGNTTHKERKKITFADEAGGKLCHVKFFEDGMASTGA